MRENHPSGFSSRSDHAGTIVVIVAIIGEEGSCAPLSLWLFGFVDGSVQGLPQLMHRAVDGSVDGWFGRSADRCSD